MYNQQEAHANNPEATIAMNQPGGEAETVQSEIASEIIQMDHDHRDDHVERSDPVITQSQGSTAGLINDDHQMTSHSLDTKETVDKKSEDNQADESETSSDNQSTQYNSRQDEEAARSTGDQQDVGHSESQNLPSSIENNRIQMIRDSDQVASDSGFNQSPDTNQTDQDDLSADSNLEENAIDAPLLDAANNIIVNDPSAQLTGVIDPLTADQRDSRESSPSSQGTESDATETYPPEESDSDSDDNPLPDIIAGSMHTLKEGKRGKLIMSLPLSPRARKVIKLSESSEGEWKSRLRSTTLVNKTGKNTKETKVSPKRKTRADSSSSSSSCSVQEFRVRDRNEEKPAEKLPTTNATHSNLAAPRRVSTPPSIHDIFRREVRLINSKNIHGG